MSVANHSPLISCICVSENRVHFLKHAIQLFLGQMYEHKELVIIGSEHDQSTIDLVKSVALPNVRLVPYSRETCTTLGDKRNFGISEAAGDYVCIWDDDDWYAPRRLSLQMKHTLESGKQGSILINLILFDRKSGKAYFSTSRPWEASLLLKRETFMNAGFGYAKLDRAEDTPLINELVIANMLFPIVAPPVFIYINHGNNTCGQSHFDYFYSQSQLLSDEISNDVRNIIDGNRSYETAQGMLSAPALLEKLDYLHFMKVAAAAGEVTL